MPEKQPIETAAAPHRPETRLWRRSGFVNDVWRALADTDDVPASGSVIVTLPRWLEQRDAFLAVAGNRHCFGVSVGSDAAITGIGDAIDGLGLIVLHFPRFTDGRAYSAARQLRQQFGYAGELRASGDVLFDQLPLMLACGFDSFEITDAATWRLLEQNPGHCAPRSYQTRLQGGLHGPNGDPRHDLRHGPLEASQTERMRRPDRVAAQAAGLFAAE